MNILNEQIKHNVYGDGEVISQEDDILSVRFSDKYGVKKFVYPDAFEKFLTLSNPEIRMLVLREFQAKREKMEADAVRLQNVYAESVKSREVVKPKRSPAKKKPSTRSKVTVYKIGSEPPAAESREGSED